MDNTITSTIWSGILSPLVSVKEGESLRHVIILDRTIEETTLTFSLDGAHASLDCVIIILADDVSIPLNIFVVAHARHTSSSVKVRSLGRNRGKVMINGVLQCLEGADESTMHFSHHALHLSPDAQTRTIPSLEIQADGIAAKHEVSAGYFDAQAVWYGQTRGVEKETMIAEMAKGFVAKDVEVFAAQTKDDLSSVFSSIHAFVEH